MKCDKCEGRGWNDNPKYWDKRNSSHILHSPSKKCMNCKGTGFVIGNIMDVLNFLHYLENTNQLLPQDRGDLRKCIDTIEKY